MCMLTCDVLKLCVLILVQKFIDPDLWIIRQETIIWPHNLLTFECDFPKFGKSLTNLKKVFSDFNFLTVKYGANDDLLLINTLTSRLTTCVVITPQWWRTKTTVQRLEHLHAERYNVLNARSWWWRAQTGGFAAFRSL